jgi:ectoine hydroxylase-related dioxygenase (phytanoyl-CoA dioxygenase family)
MAELNLDTPYVLSPKQIEDYQRDGHILLRGVCSPEEIAVYREVLVSAAHRYNTETRPIEERDTYGRAFLQIMNLWENDKAVHPFVFSKRFAGIAAQLMQAERVRLYHDQALFKEPHGGHTPWHQDQYYWPMDGPGTVTMWMPLVDADTAMGTMHFASTSHRTGMVSSLGISDESEAAFEKYVRDQGYPVVGAGAMQAGDATFHSGWTLHGAPGNSTERTREVMTIIYFADGMQIVEPGNPNRAADLARWLPGQKPGEAAGSRLNPVVYP